MRNAKTEAMTTSNSLTTAYETVEYPSGLGAVFAQGGQVVLTFKRTSGTSITFKIDEYFNESTGWVQKTEDDGTNLNLIERISTESAFSYAFTTVAEKIRVQVKGAGSEVLDLYLTVGEIL